MWAGDRAAPGEIDDQRGQVDTKIPKVQPGVRMAVLRNSTQSLLVSFIAIKSVVINHTKCRNLKTLLL